MSSMGRMLRPEGKPGQGPSELATAPSDRLRDALAVRCAEMEAGAPEALDLAAEALAELHIRLAGRASATAGTRAPKYRREQLRGEHPITLEDLAWLALNAPTALGPALDRLARPTGYRLVAHDVTGPASIHQAQAALTETFAALEASTTRAHEDGQIDLDEAIELDRAADGLQRKVAAFRQSLRAKSR